VLGTGIRADRLTCEDDVNGAGSDDELAAPEAPTPSAEPTTRGPEPMVPIDEPPSPALVPVELGIVGVKVKGINMALVAPVVPGVVAAVRPADARDLILESKVGPC